MAERRKTWARALLAHLGVHLAIATGMAGFTMGARWTWFDLGINLVANFTFSLCIGTFAVFAFGTVVPRLGARGWMRAVVLALAFAVSVGLGVELALVLLSWMSLEVTGSREIIWRFAGVVTAAMLVFNIALDRLRAHARNVELREEQARRELLEAQLANLRARLNPHFLFNSLNTLAGLIEEDPPRAIDALDRLCELLRHALETSSDRRTTLGAELDVLEDYLRMEQLRFGDRLRWTLDAAPEARTAAVPTLLLQPVVENAVKYAVAPRRHGGTITVVARTHGDRLQLDVRDDGPGNTESGGTGLGEATLRQRLSLEYGERASVHAGPREDGGYRVALDLPLQEGA